jgi:DNA-directed RNA polymerase subunit RPC12/RpoP
VNLVEVITYKCPNCGGALEFKSESQSWKCDFCLSCFDSKDIKAIEDRLLADKERLASLRIKDKEFEAKGRTYGCTSCGAEIVTDDTTAATFCYYCHSPAILPGQLSGKFRPAKVIPFKIKKEEATEAFKKWCKRKPLLSRSFTAESQLQLLSGVYVPFWLFDCDIRGRLSAEARNIRTWKSGDKLYTETKYYDIGRSATAKFVGVPADGSKKTDDRLMETLEPYDYSQMEEFSMSYLSGYLAEKYDLDDSAVYGRITERLNDYSERLLRDTISGYSSVSVRSCSIDISKTKADYVLLPTWLFTYNYKGKMYVFAMNGQTGKIAGSLPISRSRAAAWFGIISGSIFSILTIGGLLL